MAERAGEGGIYLINILGFLWIEGGRVGVGLNSVQMKAFDFWWDGIPMGGGAGLRETGSFLVARVWLFCEGPDKSRRLPCPPPPVVGGVHEGEGEFFAHPSMTQSWRLQYH
jgi:hypothetical protein